MSECCVRKPAQQRREGEIKPEELCVLNPVGAPSASEYGTVETCGEEAAAAVRSKSCWRLSKK